MHPSVVPRKGSQSVRSARCVAIETHAEMTTPYQLVRAAHRAAVSCDPKKLNRALSDPSWNVEDVDSLLALEDDDPRTTALVKAVRSRSAQSSCCSVLAPV